ncbi:MAG: hypothetical protein FVQ85_10940 [Planctomycetes bacterium]|nr:hypothetical protein [Planctomycetota bacterium]
MKRFVLITLLVVNILVLSDCCCAFGREESDEGLRKSEVSNSRNNKIAVGTPPEGMGLNPFYKKYLDCEGIAVISSERVDDRAFYRVEKLLDKMLENRPDIRKALVKDGVRYVIIAAEEQVTDIPDYADMKPKAFWNERSRGFGGRITSCGEENLLSFPTDRYEDESIFIHELAHAIDGRGLSKIEPDFKERLKRLYEDAMAKGLYKHDYASTNMSEYWAESVQAFFDADRENNWNHNHVNTRGELYEYDPKMADFVREKFGINEDNDWRYKLLVKQPSVIDAPKEIRSELISKYVWCRGFSILGSNKVSDKAMLEADRIVRNMFRYRHDVLKAIIDAKVQLAVIAQGQSPKDIPHVRKIGRKWFVNTKKSSGKQSRLFRFSAAESNLLESAGNPAAGDNLLIRDMALLMYYVTGLREIDPEYKKRKHVQQYEKGLKRIDHRFDEKVKKLYRKAKMQNLWAGTPAMKNRFNYFAEGVQSFFNANKIITAGNDPVNTREQLQGYDPDMALFIGDIFKHPKRVDWRYSEAD